MNPIYHKIKLEPIQMISDLFIPHIDFYVMTSTIKYEHEFDITFGQFLVCNNCRQSISNTLRLYPTAPIIICYSRSLRHSPSIGMPLQYIRTAINWSKCFQHLSISFHAFTASMKTTRWVHGLGLKILDTKCSHE